MINFKQGKYQKLCRKLQIKENYRDTFIEMIKLLYLILRYEHIQSSSRKAFETFEKLEIQILNSLLEIRNERGGNINYFRLLGKWDHFGRAIKRADIKATLVTHFFNKKEGSSIDADEPDAKILKLKQLFFDI